MLNDTKKFESTKKCFLKKWKLTILAVGWLLDLTGVTDLHVRVVGETVTEGGPGPLEFALPEVTFVNRALISKKKIFIILF